VLRSKHEQVERPAGLDPGDPARGLPEQVGAKATTSQARADVQIVQIGAPGRLRVEAHADEADEGVVRLGQEGVLALGGLGEAVTARA
jgi:hypothetical protein